MNSRLILLILIFASFKVSAQNTAETSTYKKHFVSTSMFMALNLFEDSPNFFQINYGHQLSERDAIIIEAITWEYRAPLGIPYSSSSYGNKEANFPGIVKDFGIGVAYQRFWWKKLYTTIHAVPMVQQYLTPNRTKIQTGFMLFTTARVGYRINLLKGKNLFIEPSVAVTHWPINSNMPDSFQKLENQWSNYFLFEPGLHIGFLF
jgi:hypothetical protein